MKKDGVGGERERKTERETRVKVKVKAVAEFLLNHSIIYPRTDRIDGTGKTHQPITTYYMLDIEYLSRNICCLLVSYVFCLIPRSHSSVISSR